LVNLDLVGRVVRAIGSCDPVRENVLVTSALLFDLTASGRPGHPELKDFHVLAQIWDGVLFLSRFWNFEFVVFHVLQELGLDLDLTVVQVVFFSSD
jgi:hypothetical protein